jgi:hypothetical protein
MAKAPGCSPTRGRLVSRYGVLGRTLGTAPGLCLQEQRSNTAPLAAYMQHRGCIRLAGGG